ncbi:MAG: nucleotidyl transferase AbiEii/AbiGii toxin family protein [Woeseiaceae bacterium]
MVTNKALSIRQRLLNLARQREEDFDYVLRQYVIQRLLYRLSVSPHVEHFLLKGALLFWVWNEDFHRPTRDIDLLTFDDNDVEYLVGVFKSIVTTDNITTNEDDGLIFDLDSIIGIEIKEDADYSGGRVTGFANLAKARIPFQIDIGYGDIVIPKAEKAILPSFLDLPSANLNIYPVYSLLSEKFQAMVMLGMANSRMKDFYDIWFVSQTISIDGQLLLDAIEATFKRRNTPLENKQLYIFTDEFKEDKGKQIQWNAFKNRNVLDLRNDFSGTVKKLQLLLEPVYHASVNNDKFQFKWLSEENKWGVF